MTRIAIEQIVSDTWAEYHAINTHSAMVCHVIFLQTVEWILREINQRLEIEEEQRVDGLSMKDAMDSDRQRANMRELDAQENTMRIYISNESDLQLQSVAQRHSAQMSEMQLRLLIYHTAKRESFSLSESSARQLIMTQFQNDTCVSKLEFVEYASRLGIVFYFKMEYRRTVTQRDEFQQRNMVSTSARTAHAQLVHDECIGQECIARDALRIDEAVQCDYICKTFPIYRTVKSIMVTTNIQSLHVVSPRHILGHARRYTASSIGNEPIDVLYVSGNNEHLELSTSSESDTASRSVTSHNNFASSDEQQHNNSQVTTTTPPRIISETTTTSATTRTVRRSSTTPNLSTAGYGTVMKIHATVHSPSPRGGGGEIVTLPARGQQQQQIQHSRTTISPKSLSQSRAGLKRYSGSTRDAYRFQQSCITMASSPISSGGEGGGGGRQRYSEPIHPTTSAATSPAHSSANILFVSGGVSGAVPGSASVSRPSPSSSTNTISPVPLSLDLSFLSRNSSVQSLLGQVTSPNSHHHQPPFIVGSQPKRSDNNNNLNNKLTQHHIPSSALAYSPPPAVGSISERVHSHSQRQNQMFRKRS
jgi:hypothetical protein